MFAFASAAPALQGRREEQRVVEGVELIPRKTPARGDAAFVPMLHGEEDGGRIIAEGAAADEIEAGMIEIVIRPVVDRDPLRRQAVPVVELEREQRRHRIAGVVAEIMPADLPAIVGKPVRKRP